MTVWVQDIDNLNLDLDNQYLVLLTDQGKLTDALQQLCSALTVDLVAQYLGSATIQEQTALNINETNSLIREICLCGDEVPWVQARVIIPNETYLQHKDILDNLGSKFIGEHFLYKQKDLTRSNFSYAILNNQPARRRIFYIEQQPILITEIFSVNILQFA